MLNLFLILVLLVGGQGILLSLILFLRKENIYANRIFAIFVFFLSLNLITVYIHDSDLTSRYPHLIGLGETFPLLYGPLVFLYLKIVFFNKNKFNTKDFIHLIPFVLWTIYGIFFFYFENPEYKLFVKNVRLPLMLQFMSLNIAISGFFYSFLNFKLYLNFRNKIQQEFSNFEKHHVAWIKHIVYTNLAVWFIVEISFICCHFIDNFSLPFGLPENAMINFPIAIMVFSYGFKQLKYGLPNIDSNLTRKENPRPEYKKSGLTDELAVNYITKLDNLMKTEKPYLNSDLKLPELALLIDISPHNLSEILNTKMNKNFFDYVNHFRVEEVKQLIENDKNKIYNLLALAMEAGFSSKSSFNSIFKKHTGITPSQFRDSINQQN